MFSKNETNDGFQCSRCGGLVAPAVATARNHCPFCLWSLHVDGEVPGDRASDCGGQMEPVMCFQEHNKWIVVHRCVACGKKQPNRIAVDDNFEMLIDFIRFQTDA